MEKKVLRSALALLLATLMVLGVVPIVALPAFAATSGVLSGLSDTSIGLNYTGTADNAWSPDGKQITGQAKSASDGCDSTHCNSTLTITNNKSSVTILSFDYTIATNEGTIKVDGNTVTASGSFSKELAAGASVTVYIESGSTDEYTKIVINNLSMVVDVKATTTFKPATNGSYTVNGAKVTSEYSNTQSSTETYALVATPASGYIFEGWYDETNQKFVSLTAKASLQIESDCTITAVFALSTTALFKTCGQMFEDLNDAIELAKQYAPTMIVLANSGTITGEYTIPKDVTLLIPFDINDTCYTTTPEAVTSYSNPSKFRELTMAAGSSLTIDGALSVSAKHYADGGSGYTGGGAPVGYCGFIKMETTSQITVRDGGALYAWGYIYGDGTVTAKSGAVVYENVQILDFRGGSSAFGLHSKAKNKAFFFNQYTVQNIEVALELEYGATENVYTSLLASGQVNSAGFTFIGNSGLFSIAEGGKIVKKYLPNQDRLSISVSGDAQISGLSMTLMGMTVDSTSYVLPLTNNLSISILSGKTTITQDIAVLPDVRITVANDAELELSKNCNLYVYDRDEWVGQKFAGAADFYAVKYSPTRTHTRTSEEMIDAQITVNGTFTVKGYIYTTTSGADIRSDGNGKIVMMAGAGTTKQAYQVAGTGTSLTSIDIISAKLHNADGSYTGTAGVTANTTFYYVQGVWTTEVPAKLSFSVDGKVTEWLWIAKDGSYTISSTVPTKTNYIFNGWNTQADGNGTSYAAGSSISISADTTLYAQWKTSQVTVTFKPNGGTGDDYTQKVNNGIATALTANAFTRTGYTFKGWNTQADGKGTSYTDKQSVTISADLILYAQWEIKTYTVTWKNHDGSVLKTESVAYGATPNYDGTTPAKQGDAQYSYTFSGWSPKISAVEGDVTYTAQFEGIVRAYTITYDANGGSGSMNAQSGNYGQSISLSENSFTQKGYTFNGWNTKPDGTGTSYSDKESIRLDGNITLYAQWKIITYTVSFQNGNAILWQGYYNYDEEPITTDDYTGTAPEKPSTTEAPYYSYKFSGWEFDSEKSTDTYFVYVPKFDELREKWHTDGSGKSYYEADAKKYHGQWAKIDNDYYYFDANGYVVTGTERVPYPTGLLPEYKLNEEDSRVNKKDNPGYLENVGEYPDDESALFVFDEGGVFQKTLCEIYDDNGVTRWIKNGMVIWHAGLVLDASGDYYYFKREGMVKGKEAYVSATNGLLKAAKYNFDESGKLIKLEGVCEDPYNPGTLCYFKDFTKVYDAGLIKIGEDYYCVYPTGEVVKGGVYIVRKTNGLLNGNDNGFYSFDEDGKVETSKNGLKEENGEKYYYQSGERVYAGLVLVDGDYYYIRGDLKAVKNGAYWVTKTNDLVKTGYQRDFDADGKMIVKSGVQLYNNVNVYYENDDIVMAEEGQKIVKTLDDGTKISIDEYGVATYLKASDGLVFEENGDVCYYEDGERVFKGLVRDEDGNYYYIGWNGKAVKDGAYWVTKTNGLMKSGYQRDFDADGKMIVKSGVQTFNGVYVYYENDDIVMAAPGQTIKKVLNDGSEIVIDEDGVVKYL